MPELHVGSPGGYVCIGDPTEGDLVKRCLTGGIEVGQ